MSAHDRVQILKYLRSHPWSTRGQLVQALMSTLDVIRRDLDKLVAEGKVVKQRSYDGNNSFAFAVIGESMPPPLKPVARRITSPSLQQAILHYLQTSPWLRVDALAKGLRMSAIMIRSNLQELVEAEKVEKRKANNQTNAYVYALAGETSPLPQPVAKRKASIKLQIAYFLSMHPGSRVEDIAHRLQLSTDTVYRKVNEMLNEGKIVKRKKGDGKRTYVYELVEDL
jgi:DeoR/GlpR family transcriptional regulator of sugar metabolism